MVSDETASPCLIQPLKIERMSSKRKLIARDDTLNRETQCGSSIECKREDAVDNMSEEKFGNAMDRAKKLQANLSGAHPSFVKLMLFSHVSGSFWMYVPTKFCHEHLPKEDCIFTLVDEVGRETKTNFLVRKHGLSAGWRGFAISHHLRKDDVLVFHLIHPTTFKVYIIREQRLDEVNGTPELLESDACTRQMISEKAGTSFQMILHTENNSDSDSQPEVLDGIRLSDSDLTFEAITGFEDFNIIVDGLVIDSKFSHANLRKYYELCRSQNSFLHDSLLKGLNCNLVVGIILETVNIADAIKVCTSSTSTDDLRTWKTTLDGFELLGMKVSFLRAKLNSLLGIADESKTCMFEPTDSSKRILALENNIMDLHGVMEKIEFEIEDALTASVGKHETKIKEIANTPHDEQQQ